jgi:hypothetical protein
MEAPGLNVPEADTRAILFFSEMLLAQWWHTGAMKMKTLRQSLPFIFLALLLPTGRGKPGLRSFRSSHSHSRL